MQTHLALLAGAHSARVGLVPIQRSIRFGPNDQRLLFAVLEIIALSCLTAVFVLSVVLSMVSRKNKTLFAEHTITLGEDSFTEETPYKKTEQKWAIVQKLARTKSYIFIYVAQHEAHIVPRRAFRDDAEWDAFYEYCRQRTRTA